MLCCYLVALQFTGQDTNVSADSMGDDLYTWNVELWRTAFKPDCQLAQVRAAPPGSRQLLSGLLELLAAAGPAVL